MEDHVSGRVIDQRVRNRIMQVVELLADGPEGVRGIGTGNAWFEEFFDFLREDEHADLLSTLSAPERQQLKALLRLVNEGSSATQGPHQVAQKLMM